MKSGVKIMFTLTIIMGGGYVVASRRWTTEEVQKLEKLVGLSKVEKIAEMLGRSKSSVQNKIAKLGLSARNNTDYIIMTDFCEALNVHRSTAEYWIREKGLPSKRIDKYRVIHTQKFWEWAYENQRLIAWNRFDSKNFGRVPKWVHDTKRDYKPTHHWTSKRWTDYEIATLKYLVSKYEYTYQDISKKLNRSESAIKRKLYDLGSKGRPIPRAKKNYSETEIQLIVTLRRQGKSIQEIAEKVNGSAMYIQDRINLWEGTIDEKN